MQQPYQYQCTTGCSNIEPQHFGSALPQGSTVNVQPAVFSSFEPYQLQESEARNLDMLLDIPFK